MDTLSQTIVSCEHGYAILKLSHHGVKGSVARLK
jgi:hypothetical protein